MPDRGNSALNRPKALSMNMPKSPPIPPEESRSELDLAPDPNRGGMDTAFFTSRGRQLMFTPMQELLAICDRLALQAKALGKETMAPDFAVIAEAARHLITQMQAGDDDTVPQLKLPSLLADFSQDSTPKPASPRLPSGPPIAKWLPLSLNSPNAAPQSQLKSILLVEDNPRSSEMVILLLEQCGYVMSLAVNGEQALEKIQHQSFDLVLLDILLPEMNGYVVLEKLRENPRFRYLPVIMLSGVGDMDSVVRCIEMGADDYLPKPFNPVLLKARLEACLEKKWLRDKEEANLRQLQMEREKSDILLRSILPQPIADRLKQGEHTIVDYFEDVTVLFADLVGFSSLASSVTPQELVQSLNEVFTAFDELADRHGLEKIKTIGDAYMVVGGLPTPRPDHPQAIAQMALDMQAFMHEHNRQHHANLSIRIGIHTGPVTAGIIGRNKFAYDLWGDTVNVASRMESLGLPNAIQTTVVTAERLRDQFQFRSRGVIEVKGKGPMTTYLLEGRS